MTSPFFLFHRSRSPFRSRGVCRKKFGSGPNLSGNPELSLPHKVLGINSRFVYNLSTDHDGESAVSSARVVLSGGWGNRWTP